MDLASPNPATDNEGRNTTVVPESAIEDISFWGGEDHHVVSNYTANNPNYNNDSEGRGGIVDNEDFELLLETEDDDDLSLDHEDDDDVDIDDEFDDDDDDDDDEEEEEEEDDIDDDDEGDEMDLIGHR